MPAELEIKLRILDDSLSPQHLLVELQGLLAVSAFTSRHLHNVYFDSPDLALHGSKTALRLREAEGQWWQTFKTQGVVVNGLHRRGEWEWPVANKCLDAEKLREVDVWPGHVAVQSLVPVFETNFERHKTVLDYHGAEIELVLDVGEIVSGPQRDRIFELECELLAGDEQCLLQLSEYLQQQLPVEAYDCSKAERGYALFGAEPQ